MRKNSRANYVPPGLVVGARAEVTDRFPWIYTTKQGDKKGFKTTKYGLQLSKKLGVNFRRASRSKSKRLRRRREAKRNAQLE